MFGRGPRDLPKSEWGKFYLPNARAVPPPPSSPPAGTAAEDVEGGAAMGEENKTVTRAAHIP
eukprot:10884636-Alexandrium_andersonii.AAC.1